MINKDRVVFFSERDMAGGFELRKGEHILRAEAKSDYTDINDILELYHIKQYIDNGIYLNTWTQDDISHFKQTVSSYGTIIGKFMSSIISENFKSTYQSIIFDYVSSFWKIINDYGLSKQITKENLLSALNDNPFLIREILQHKKIVEHFNTTIKDYLLSHSETATILLSIYEIEKNNTKEKYYLPPSLTVEDKEIIILNYLDSPEVNMNYLPIIQNARNRDEFKLSDKTRLKAKRLNEKKIDEFFNTNSGIKCGVSICFSEDASKIKEGIVKDSFNIEYIYSLNFIKENNTPHALFENFHYLFEYLDDQHRIRLTNKKNSMDVLERVIGVHSPHEYRTNFVFRSSENTALLQIASYKSVLEKMGSSLEDTLVFVFSTLFAEKYGFANNARLTMPTGGSYLEKVRSLAPEFESLLKQYKLFVEDGCIDFELLEMSSSPYSVKDIPSLVPNKYIYLKDSQELLKIIQLFFSDQTGLSYVDPFKDKQYHTLFDLLAHEDVAYNQYKEYQKTRINYLIDKMYLYIDGNGSIQFVNPVRVSILYDLFLNEAASFYRYDPEFRLEVLEMGRAGLIYFGNTLFSIPEQSYFNYHLNKSEFTNGLDLRNKYAHGTSADPNKTKEHQYAYLMYLKLIVLSLLKIEDDLIIHKAISDFNNSKNQTN